MYKVAVDVAPDARQDAIGQIAKETKSWCVCSTNDEFFFGFFFLPSFSSKWIKTAKLRPDPRSTYKCAFRRHFEWCRTVSSLAQCFRQRRQSDSTDILLGIFFYTEFHTEFGMGCEECGEYGRTTRNVGRFPFLVTQTRTYRHTYLIRFMSTFLSISFN